jgi:dUTP pyrophosphatase
MNIKIKKLHERAMIPTFATKGSACFDLYAMVEDSKKVSIYKHSPAIIRTGLSFEIPKGHAMMIYSRSGHGFNNDVRLSNCVGVIDSDYRGEVKVKLAADGGGFGVSHGDRIAQAMIIPVPAIEGFFVSNELSETERGDGGFGSTGS